MLGAGPGTYAFEFPFVPMLLSPILLAAIGIYVLRDGALFQRLAYSTDDGESTEKMTDYFTLGVRLLGVHFVLGSIPTLSQTLSNFIFVANSRDSSAPGVVEGLGMSTNFLPQMVLILFGLFLLRRGNRLIWLAFPNNTRIDNAEN
jgi:hypothetical protein